MNTIEKKVLNTIKKYKMLKKGDKVVLAVSGGYDSVAMLLLMKDISKIFSLKLFIAHLNHCLRGKESDKDEKYVKKLGKKFGIEVFVKKVDVLKLKKTNPFSSIEELGRAERYKFFFEIAKSLDAQKIATAHTADDKIENFFLGFLEGKSLKSLAGIPPVQNKVIRPLIECFRSEILEYLKQKKMKPRVDKSNFDVKIPRNFIRLKLIPFIEKNFKPLKKPILQTVEIIRTENDFFENIIKNLLKNVRFSKDSIYNAVLQFKIENLPLPILRRLIREILIFLNKEPSYDEIVFLSENIKLKKQNIKMNDIYYWSWNNYRIFTKEKRIDYKFVLAQNKSEIIDFLNLKVYYVIEENIIRFEPKALYLNFDKVADKLIIIRKRKEGDKIKLLNTDYYVSLKKLFIDLKIPKILRDYIPVIEIEGEIAGLFLNIFPLYLNNRVSENYKVMDKQKKVIKLYIEQWL